MTSYGGIIRIRCRNCPKTISKGSKFENVLSACIHKLPCICLSGVFYTHRG